MSDSARGVTTTVHLLRHGEVDNPKGVLYGRLPDYHLSELGVQMAERVAKTVSGRDITYLVASRSSPTNA
jgi:broad specificity phosphatase PhoE